LTGFTGVGINGVGSQILKTTDGGATWLAVWPDNSTKTPANLFLSAVVRTRTSVVVTGVLAQAYSIDGTSFDDSLNDYLEPSQDAECMPDGDFAIVVAGNKVNGVATSHTGATWTNIDMGVNSTIWLARYGAFPTQSTWFVTAGVFPTSSTGDENFKPMNENLGRDKMTGKFHFTYDRETSTPPVDCNVDPLNCYSAGVFKTTDSGKTWTQVFSNVNQGDNIYPNDIDCFDANNCVFVVEGDTCRILSTTNGGASWTESMHDTDTACSLVYTVMLSQKETWIGGGHLSALNFEGRFWHSTDGATTWVKDAVKGLYILDIDMNTLYGYALGLDASGSGMQLLKHVQ